MICHWCGEQLRYDRRRGWVHPQGGAYMMRCVDCGWQGAPYPGPTRCPRCGGEVRDSHAALPENPPDWDIDMAYEDRVAPPLD